MTAARSYAEQLRESLAALPVKKKCCLHAMDDARKLFAENLTSGERAAQIRTYRERAKCPACLPHFVRELFILHGSVTDPDKRYHLEFSFGTEEECGALGTLLAGEGVSGGIAVRKKQYIFYLKDGEAIADLLAYLGANNAAFDFMNSRIKREFRNTVNRQVNCDTANIEKTLLASERQIAVIRRMEETGALNKLPESLRETALLRVRYEQMPLKELGEAHEPPITKSGVNHRLAKIMSFARTLGIE